MVLFQSQDEYKDEVMVATSIKSSGKGRLELVRNHPYWQHHLNVP
jgi:hypothetical protein